MAASRFRIWFAGIPVILLSGLFIYFTKPDDGVAVRVVAAGNGPIQNTLTTNGKVEPTDREELRAIAPGFVRAIFVHEGDRVRPGQALMELERGQAQAAVAQAQAELDASRSEFQMIESGGSAAELSETAQKLKDAQAARDEAARTLAINERLLEKNAVARTEVEQSRERLRQATRDVEFYAQRSRSRFNQEDRSRAESRVKSARAALAYAQQQLSSTRVVASRAGTLYSLPVHQSSFVNTGDVLARIGNLDVVRVHTFVDEPELGRLRQGEEAQVRWDALPGNVWSGVVDRLPAEVTSLGSRNVGEVICTINNKDRRLIANVNVDVEIIVESKPSALILPKEAVLHSDHGTTDHYVFVVDGDVVRRANVKLGTSDATRFEIVSGLQPGQKVAVPGDRPLSDGDRIRPIT